MLDKREPRAEFPGLIGICAQLVLDHHLPRFNPGPDAAVCGLGGIERLAGEKGGKFVGDRERGRFAECG